MRKIRSLGLSFTPWSSESDTQRHKQRNIVGDSVSSLWSEAEVSKVYWYDVWPMNSDNLGDQHHLIWEAKVKLISMQKNEAPETFPLGYDPRKHTHAHTPSHTQSRKDKSNIYSRTFLDKIW